MQWRIYERFGPRTAITMVGVCYCRFRVRVCRLGGLSRWGLFLAWCVPNGFALIFLSSIALAVAGQGMSVQAVRLPWSGSRRAAGKALSLSSWGLQRGRDLAVVFVALLPFSTGELWVLGGRAGGDHLLYVYFAARNGRRNHGAKRIGRDGGQLGARLQIVPAGCSGCLSLVSAARGHGVILSNRSTDRVRAGAGQLWSR